MDYLASDNPFFLMFLSYPYSFINNIDIKRRLERSFLPLFAKHNQRTNDNAAFKFNFV